LVRFGGNIRPVNKPLNARFPIRLNAGLSLFRSAGPKRQGPARLVRDDEDERAGRGRFSGRVERRPVHRSGDQGIAQARIDRGDCLEGGCSWRPRLRFPLECRCHADADPDDRAGSFARSALSRLGEGRGRYRGQQGESKAGKGRPHHRRSPFCILACGRSRQGWLLDQKPRGFLQTIEAAITSCTVPDRIRLRSSILHANASAASCMFKHAQRRDRCKVALRPEAIRTRK
jgi:hypothetical protein